MRMFSFINHNNNKNTYIAPYLKILESAVQHAKNTQSTQRKTLTCPK